MKTVFVVFVVLALCGCESLPGSVTEVGYETLEETVSGESGYFAFFGVENAPRNVVYERALKDAIDKSGAVALRETKVWETNYIGALRNPLILSWMTINLSNVVILTAGADNEMASAIGVVTTLVAMASLAFDVRRIQVTGIPVYEEKDTSGDE